MPMLSVRPEYPSLQGAESGNSGAARPLGDVEAPAAPVSNGAAAPSTSGDGGGSRGSSGRGGPTDSRSSFEEDPVLTT